MYFLAQLYPKAASRDEINQFFGTFRCFGNYFLIFLSV